VFGVRCSVNTEHLEAPWQATSRACDTGAVETGERVARVREVRRRLVRDGPSRTRHREGDFETVTLPERDCDLLRDLLIAERAETVVEAGLAYASSALAIGEALVTVGMPRPRHVVIDPFQESAWSNVGWELLRSAGLDSIATLTLTPSSIALARLAAEGLIADAAFVDGSHRFHEVFVDLYFLRKIVRPGGLIIMDDDWAPSVRTAALLRAESRLDRDSRCLRRRDAAGRRYRPRIRGGAPLPGIPAARPVVRASLRGIPPVLSRRRPASPWPAPAQRGQAYRLY
jgi:predicted O-methyltransferase YrrM